MNPHRVGAFATYAYVAKPPVKYELVTHTGSHLEYKTMTQSDLQLKYERSNDGIVTLWLDQPEKPVVVLDSWLLGQIKLFLDELDQEPAPTGFILCSASDRVFVAGADLNEIGGLNDSDLDAYLAMGQDVFNRIEQLDCPSVACINGAALGGGLEIALACQYRLAADGGKRGYPIGLPEAGLGILPGWGGTQRLAAVIEGGHALGRTMTGRTFTPKVAMRYGLIEKIVPADQLLTEANALIKADTDGHKRARIIQDRKSALNKTLEWAKSCQTNPTRTLPAATRVIEAVQIGLNDGLEAGLKAERQALIDLRNSEESKGMLGAFFARGGALKKAMKRLTEPPSPTAKIAILGSSPFAKQLTKRLGRKSEVQTITTDTTSCDADLLIAAVDGDLRQDHLAALRHLAGIAHDDAVIASTAAVLGVDEIAENITNPKRLIGIKPVRPAGNAVVEVLRGSETSDATVGAALMVVKALAGVPIVQKSDGPTLMMRLFGEVAVCAWEIATTTTDPAAVDRAARAVGFATGPLKVLDMVGLSTVAGLVGNADMFASVERIYLENEPWKPHTSFLAHCDTDETDSPDVVAAEDIGHQLLDALKAAAELAITEKRIESKEIVWLAATFGLNLAPWQRQWFLDLP